MDSKKNVLQNFNLDSEEKILSFLEHILNIIIKRVKWLKINFKNYIL